MNNESNWRSVWEQAAQELGLRVEYFTPVLGVGPSLVPAVRISDFGGVNGMLIFEDYVRIEPLAEDLLRAGYGYTVMSEPGADDYDRDDFIEMLSDWGWVGTSAPPSWVDSMDE